MAGFSREELSKLAMSKEGGYVTLPAGQYTGTIGEIVVEEKEDKNGDDYQVASASIRNIAPADDDDMDVIAEAATEWKEGASPDEFLSEASVRFQVFMFRKATAVELHRQMLKIAEVDPDDFYQACKDIKGSEVKFRVKVGSRDDGSSFNESVTRLGPVG